jgi:BirA family biotin operon repressor/biotin-[acetyl-CoA-carboxylase] ligase
MVEHQAEADSTMVRAREIAADPLCLLPAAVIADRQTHGRGRRGASWWQPPGSLAVSIVLDATAAGTEAAAAPPPSWSLACGVAIAETLRALDPDVQAMVRWPNDIEVQGRKLAGILVETAGCGRAIFGIGVNTTGIAAAAPVPLRARVATFPDLTGRSLPRERLLVAFLPRFLGLLRGMAADEGILAARYRPLCSLDGHAVTIHAGDGRHHGLCRGIAGDGALVLDTPSGRMRLVSGSLTDPADVWRGDWNS